LLHWRYPLQFFLLNPLLSSRLQILSLSLSITPEVVLDRSQKGFRNPAGCHEEAGRKVERL